MTAILLIFFINMTTIFVMSPNFGRHDLVTDAGLVVVYTCSTGTGQVLGCRILVCRVKPRYFAHAFARRRKKVY